MTCCDTFCVGKGTSLLFSHTMNIVVVIGRDESLYNGGVVKRHAPLSAFSKVRDYNCVGTLFQLIRVPPTLF
jgi:hypothetical protein